MTKRLHAELKAVERDLVEMSTTVEEMIADACRSLCKRRLELLDDIMTAEDSVNRSEVQIETDCLRLLALYNPVCVDLRRVTTILKVSRSLERIADIAINMSERAISLTNLPPFEVPLELNQMAMVAAAMVRASLDSMIFSDVETARGVCHKDKQVNTLNRAVLADLNQAMRSKPAMIEPAMHCFSASRNVKRIADHATNIAEDVIFLINGKIARHSQDVVQPQKTPASHQ